MKFHHILRSVFSLLAISAFLQAAIAQPQSLTVLLSGDTYGYFDITTVGKSTAGGIVRRKTIVDRTRWKTGPDNLLLLDNGNALGYYYLLRGDRGKTMIEAMKDLRYDAMTVGIHELSYGSSTLLSYADSLSGLSIVCANILDRAKGTSFLRPYVILQKGNNVRVAILGLTDPDIEQHALPKNIQGLSFADPVQTAQQFVPMLAKEADVVILLTQLSTSVCSAIAREIPGIHLIVARAENGNASLVTTVKNLERGQSTVLVQPERFGSSISRLEIDFDHSRQSVSTSLEELIPIDASVPADFGFASRLNIAADKQYSSYAVSSFGAEPDEPLALLDDSFTNEKLTDAILLALIEKTGSEVALLNKSLFRFEGTGFPRSERDPALRKVTIRSLEQMIQNLEILVMRLTGQQIAAIQKQSAARERSGTNILHSQVTSQGTSEWYIHNAPPVQTNPPEYYRVVTTNFLAGGGDGYADFRSGKVLGNAFLNGETLRGAEKGIPIVLSDFVIQTMKRSTPQEVSFAEPSIADPAYLERPLWRFSIARLQLNYGTGQFRGASDYRNVGLTELRASDFTRITYEGDFRLRQDSRLFIWDNRFYGVLGQSKVTDQPLQETADDLFFETVLNFRPSSFGNGISLYPSGSFKYDTEFTPTEGTATVNGQTVNVKNPRQKDMTIGLGVGLSDFAGFSRTRISFTQTFDRSKTPRPDENGINLQTMYQVPVLSALFRSEFDGTYYIKHKNSTGDTRRLLVRWKGDLSIPLSSNLYIAPSLNLFLFQGQNSTTPGQTPRIATAVVAGITLGFSRDWKMQYDPLF